VKNEKGFATVFSLFMSLLLFSFCSTFVIVATVLSVKHKANHAAEEAALLTASTLDCERAIEIAKANDSEILTCSLNPDHVYIETFSESNSCSSFSHMFISFCDKRFIGRAKSI
jgi:hypothetical protein